MKTRRDTLEGWSDFKDRLDLQMRTRAGAVGKREAWKSWDKMECPDESDVSAFSADDQNHRWRYEGWMGERRRKPEYQEFRGASDLANQDRDMHQDQKRRQLATRRVPACVIGRAGLRALASLIQRAALFVPLRFFHTLPSHRNMLDAEFPGCRFTESRWRDTFSCVSPAHSAPGSCDGGRAYARSSEKGSNVCGLEGGGRRRVREELDGVEPRNSDCRSVQPSNETHPLRACSLSFLPLFSLSFDLLRRAAPGRRQVCARRMSSVGCIIRLGGAGWILGARAGAAHPREVSVGFVVSMECIRLARATEEMYAGGVHDRGRAHIPLTYWFCALAPGIAGAGCLTEVDACAIARVQTLIHQRVWMDTCSACEAHVAVGAHGGEFFPNACVRLGCPVCGDTSAWMSSRVRSPRWIYACMGEVYMVRCVLGGQWRVCWQRLGARRYIDIVVCMHGGGGCLASVFIRAQTSRCSFWRARLRVIGAEVYAIPGLDGELARRSAMGRATTGQCAGTMDVDSAISMLVAVEVRRAGLSGRVYDLSRAVLPPHRCEEMDAQGVRVRVRDWSLGEQVGSRWDVREASISFDAIHARMPLIGICQTQYVMWPNALLPGLDASHSICAYGQREAGVKERFPAVDDFFGLSPRLFSRCWQVKGDGAADLGACGKSSYPISPEEYELDGVNFDAHEAGATGADKADVGPV
ncbi:hypothetical protein B0H13DRAFT_2298643 [Mycena leptocephala]|nr:hypothetical protein B0H13DRAFT_2298643 [Mycena leptocephala]